MPQYEFPRRGSRVLAPRWLARDLGSAVRRLRLRRRRRSLSNNILPSTLHRKDDYAVNREQILTYNEKNIADFRSNGGRIAAFGDAPVLLLTTTGARSGQQRTSPMMYLADEHYPNRVYVFAS